VSFVKFSGTSVASFTKLLEPIVFQEGGESMKLLGGSLVRSGWLLGLVLLLCTAPPVAAQISVGIGVPSLDIGIHLPGLPSLTIVPGSPVYYAPQVNTNFFCYDGMYWVYQDESWYASSW
jgi:hypothetical protein